MAGRVGDRHELAPQVVRCGVGDADLGVGAGTDRPIGAAKCTSLFWRVRPVVIAASRLLGPSTSTSSTRPIRARWRASADRSTTTRRRSNRSAMTSAATNSSTRSAASVPGRGLKMNV